VVCMAGAEATGYGEMAFGAGGRGTASAGAEKGITVCVTLAGRCRFTL
jgi:hypothetical protein